MQHPKEAILKKEKIYYIDNLRILLTALVVLHHCFVTYGAPGGWYYSEKTTTTGALIPMTLFVATNQSFFMGFFFFLSALFTPSSYEKKGPRQFIIDRLKRLGIPLVFYSLILSPILSYLVYRFGKDNKITLWQYLDGFHHWVDFGVLWFVAALLLFMLIYVLVMPLIKTRSGKWINAPGNRTILLFAISLGLISYIVRIFFPVGWVLQPLGFQLAHFSQYIAMFIIGIMAARNNWLDNFDAKKARTWFWVAIVMIFAVFPLMYVIKTITGSAFETFEGSGTYQSFLSATWEQLTGIAIMVTLLGFARKRWNRQSLLLKNMSRSAYGVYIIHPLILISLSLLFKGLAVDPAFKVLMVGPLAVVFSFLTGALLVKVPGVKKVI
jgi:surface polysaccharide O-acyltransferase-like enzyme